MTFDMHERRRRVACHRWPVSAYRWGTRIPKEEFLRHQLQEDPCCLDCGATYDEAVEQGKRCMVICQPCKNKKHEDCEQNCPCQHRNVDQDGKPN